jgi:hypothetical protein
MGSSGGVGAGLDMAVAPESVMRAVITKAALRVKFLVKFSMSIMGWGKFEDAMNQTSKKVKTI